MNKIFLLSGLLLTASTTIIGDLKASAPAMSKMPNYSAYFDNVRRSLSAIQEFVNTCSTEAAFKERCLLMLTDAYASYKAAVAEAYNEQKKIDDEFGNHAIGRYGIRVFSELRSLAEQAKISVEFDNFIEKKD